MPRLSPMEELESGIEYWHNRGPWPPDFHNLDYVEMDRQNPHGAFDLTAWRHLLKRLNAWRATRPFSGAVLEARYVQAMPDLCSAWQTACAPHVDDDIVSVTWEQVAAFPAVVTPIKPTLTPTATPSPMFTSKFCHFLLPKVFPVVDTAAMGGRWRTYEEYFRCVQDEWAATPATDRDSLVTRLTELIEAEGSPVFDQFPMVNKVVELRLIGREQQWRL